MERAIIASNTPDGRCRLSWQSSLAGQTIAVHLGVRSDLAPLTYPTAEPDSVSTAHWLGTVDDLALHNLETLGEERWYRFRTAHRGTLTLAVSDVVTAENAQVALFDDLADTDPLRANSTTASVRSPPASSTRLSPAQPKVSTSSVWETLPAMTTSSLHAT